MRNIKLSIEFDGTRYVGWQRQENGKSIQGEIERVLAKMLQEEVALIGAGRTDSGVHARGQVANFRTESSLTLHEMRRGMNGLLPGDIVVHSVEEVTLDFHARFSAKSRVYSYLVTLVPSAIGVNYSWYVSYELDPALMNSAAGAVVGTHDFASFCKSESELDHCLCTVARAAWQPVGATLRFEIEANRFVHGMVRALVGTMVDVGRGYTTLHRFREIVACKDRKTAGMSAPARGLVLERVVY